jgi:hypothetical protein
VLGDRARADVDRGGDGLVGAARGGELQDLDLPVGEFAAAVGARPGQGGARPALGARPAQGVAQRRLQHAQQRGVGVGEVRPGPVERDRDQPVVGRAWHAERDLVLDRDVPEEFRINTEPVELLAAGEIADPGRVRHAGGPVVDQQWVLVQVLLECRDRGGIEAAEWIFGVIAEVIRQVPDFVVCRDVAAHQDGQAGQDVLGRVLDLARIAQAVDKLCGPAQRVQRNIHARHPPGCVLMSLGAQYAYRHFRRITV